jgi:hypothetical protein
MQTAVQTQQNLSEPCWPLRRDGWPPGNRKQEKATKQHAYAESQIIPRTFPSPKPPIFPSPVVISPTSMTQLGLEDTSGPLYLHWPPLWSSGLSFLQEILRSGFDSRCYQILWEVVSLGLVSITGELLGRNCSGSGLQNWEYNSKHPSRWARDILYPQKLVLNSLTSGGRSVGIVRSWITAKESVFFVVCISTVRFFYS